MSCFVFEQKRARQALPPRRQHATSVAWAPRGVLPLPLWLFLSLRCDC